MKWHCFRSIACKLTVSFVTFENFKIGHFECQLFLNSFFIHTEWKRLIGLHSYQSVGLMFYSCTAQNRGTQRKHIWFKEGKQRWKHFLIITDVLVAKGCHIIWWKRKGSAHEGLDSKTLQKCSRRVHFAKTSPFNWYDIECGTHMLVCMPDTVRACSSCDNKWCPGGTSRLGVGGV